MADKPTSGASGSPAHAPLRIAYLVGTFPHVSETFIANQIVGIAARGHRVDIYATVPRAERRVPASVRRYRLTEHTYPLFGSSNALVRFWHVVFLLVGWGWRVPRIVLRSLNAARYGRLALSLGLLHAALELQRRAAGRYDVVHCQFGTYGRFALYLSEIGALSGKLVVSFRGFDATKHLRAHPRAYDELFRRADLLLPVSRVLAERLIAAGCDRTKIVVHHSGIVLDQFRASRRDKPTQPVVRLLSVARLTEKKGIEYGIRAVARVLAQGRRVQYDIVGDGPLRASLSSLPQELGVAGCVSLLGERNHEEVIELLDESDVFVAPSVTAADGDEEGIPNSVKEAMAMGVPIIATRHGGIPELVEDGKSGFLVPERDSDEVANRIAEIIDHPEIRVAMGRAGRKRVKLEFDIDRLNDELAALYANLAERRDAGRNATSRSHVRSSAVTV